MQTKTAFILIVSITAVISIITSADHYNDQQQTLQITSGDTAPADYEYGVNQKTEPKAVTITLADDTNGTIKKKKLTPLPQKKKQTIKGLLNLGGFNKDDKEKRVSKN